MMLTPKLEVLPKEQRILWNELKCIPKDFVLYGGTAVALRYGHRDSVDFDFFSVNRAFNFNLLYKLPLLNKYDKLEQKLSANHHNFLIKISPELKNVQVSFINCPDIIPGYIKTPDKSLSNGIQIASPLDLMACKILALNQRSTVKDFVDLAELIKNNISLEDGFCAALHLAKNSRVGESQLNLSALKEDLKSKTLENFLGDFEAVNMKKDPSQYINILKIAAEHLDLNKVYKRKFKIQKDLSCQALSR